MGSGKSSLVHRYLTGTYSQDDSPEGGRFKKEVTIDGHCYLLLIRDEGSLPDSQFTHWADAVIFVFGLDNEATFDFVWTAYSRMSHFRNISGLPTILVGTQDGICETNPRVIDEKRARRLAADIHTNIFLETCALYGLNVDRVFLESKQILSFIMFTLLIIFCYCNSMPENYSIFSWAWITPRFKSPTGLSTIGAATQFYPTNDIYETCTNSTRVSQITRSTYFKSTVQNTS